MGLSRHCVRPIFDIVMPADANKGESCFPVDEQERGLEELGLRRICREKKIAARPRLQEV